MLQAAGEQTIDCAASGKALWLAGEPVCTAEAGE